MIPERTDIFINGGGIPGLALALLLGRAGLDVVVADPFPPKALKLEKPENRTSALMQSSLETLRKTGAWEMAEPFGETMSVLRIVDESGARKGKPLQVDFSAAEIGLEYFGVNIPNNILRLIF
jgi:2-octaprenyl-6-methoxyphenol hydroxylase